MNAASEAAAFAASENVNSSGQKIQPPTSKIQRRSKHQARITAAKSEQFFGSWMLDLFWTLDLGFWIFTTSPPILRARARSRVARREGSRRPPEQSQSAKSRWPQKSGAPPLRCHQEERAFQAGQAIAARQSRPTRAVRLENAERSQRASRWPRQPQTPAHRRRGRPAATRAIHGATSVAPAAAPESPDVPRDSGAGGPKPISREMRLSAQVEPAETTVDAGEA